VGVLFYSEPLGLMRLGFILMLVAAIVGLKFVSH
jgi:multidrug transporter EmrE-like cation transporter